MSPRLSVSRFAAFLVLLLAVGGTACAAEPSPETRAEIAHLLSYLEQSGCTFYRNGKWYDSAQARAHLERYRAARGGARAR